MSKRIIDKTEYKIRSRATMNIIQSYDLLNLSSVEMGAILRGLRKTKSNAIAENLLKKLEELRAVHTKSISDTCQGGDA